MQARLVGTAWNGLMTHKVVTNNKELLENRANLGANLWCAWHEQIVSTASTPVKGTAWTRQHTNWHGRALCVTCMSHLLGKTTVQAPSFVDMVEHRLAPAWQKLSSA